MPVFKAKQIIVRAGNSETYKRLAMSKRTVCIQRILDEVVLNILGRT